MENTQIKEKLDSVFSDIKKVIIWQDNLIRDIVISLFAWWHILIEWAPGLAKTLSVKSIAKLLSLNFNRIQFTPDLLPSDLIWARIYNAENKTFDIKHGPIFTNLILADEINRAPSKLQSALLESMAEKQVTIWEETFKLDSPFMVLATQNPIEQDGTYSLPEAQLDRFLLKTIVSYPNREEELEIMKSNSEENFLSLKRVLTKKDISSIKDAISKVYVDENIYAYVRDLVFYTRDSKLIWKYLIYWASPRASIALINVSKVLAFLNGRDYVIPEDIKEMVYGVLRHRIILSYESIADWVSSDDIISLVLSNVNVK